MVDAVQGGDLGEQLEKQVLVEDKVLADLGIKAVMLRTGTDGAAGAEEIGGGTAKIGDGAVKSGAGGKRLDLGDD
jgi:hypothetical protein